MNVLHICESPNFGGIEMTLLTLARESQECKSMTPFFALCHENCRLGIELRNGGSTVFNLGPAKSRFPWQILRARFRLKSLLKKHPFDVIIFHSSWSLAFFSGIARSEKIPFVLWMHNNSTIEGSNLIERYAGKKCPNFVICNSNYTANSLPLLFRVKRPPHRVIYCPVSPKTSSSDPVLRSALREKFKTSADDVVIIQVGRMVRWKGFHLLLEALSKLREIPGWIYWIVGGPQCEEEKSYYDELLNLVKEYDMDQNVRFLGLTNDVAQALSAADIFCQPGSSEPFGIAVVEALYAGVPVVTSNKGGSIEIVDESCSLLFPADDGQALSDTLKKLLLDKKLIKQLSAFASFRALNISAPSKILPQVYAVLTGLR